MVSENVDVSQDVKLNIELFFFLMQMVCIRFAVFVTLLPPPNDGLIPLNDIKTMLHNGLCFTCFTWNGYRNPPTPPPAAPCWGFRKVDNLFLHFVIIINYFLYHVWHLNANKKNDIHTLHSHSSFRNSILIAKKSFSQTAVAVYGQTLYNLFLLQSV